MLFLDKNGGLYMSRSESQAQNEHGLLRNYIARQQTVQHPAISLPSSHQKSLILPDSTDLPKSAIFHNDNMSTKRLYLMRGVALALVLLLLIALYLIWRPTSSQEKPAITVQHSLTPSLSSPEAANSSPSQGPIQVYILGAVKVPGVYTLEADARVYQLLQKAGGPLPNANLVALNLAAKLTDGQQVYVTIIGERPPTYSGGIPGPNTGSETGSSLVNINTAGSDEMREKLHVSSTTAQAIISYRTQKGPYTSIEQLQQVVSKSIYDKIKGQVTI
jgi:competence protein ComEA